MVYHPQIAIWESCQKVVALGGGTLSQSKERQPSMGDRYLSRQGSGVWRSLRDGDFEEEDVWDVIRDRKNSNTMTVGSKESSVSVSRRLPSASRMIPSASSYHDYGGGMSSYSSSSNNTQEAKIMQQSAPLHISNWSSKAKKGSPNVSWHNERDDSDGDEEAADDGVEDEEEDEYDAKEPPHEFIARRLARSQISSFSVFEGAGRTLKGRDLSKVRNAVLTKTGFLESL